MKKLLLLIPLLAVVACETVDDQPAEEETPARGTLVSITSDTAYDTDGFLDTYAYRFPTINLQEIDISEFTGSSDFLSGILSATGTSTVDISEIVSRAIKTLVSPYETSLASTFADEQPTTSTEYEMRTVSYTYNSIGFDGKPIVLSGAVAFPCSKGGAFPHTISEIVLNHHAGIDSNDNVPSVYGDITFVRALQNCVIVCPDYEGMGGSVEHFSAATEVDANAWQAVDALVAAKEILSKYNIVLPEDFHTLNLGISLGGEHVLGFQHYMDVVASQEEIDAVHLTRTYGGAGIARPNLYFSNDDERIGDFAQANLGLALNTVEGILGEIPSSKFGGYDPWTDFISNEFKSCEVVPGVNFIKTRRDCDYYYGFENENIHQRTLFSIFQDDMLSEDRSAFDMTSPKTQALFDYFESVDLGQGWTPKTKLTYVWSEEDINMYPYMQKTVYDNLSNNGALSDLVTEQVLPSYYTEKSDILAHALVCAQYYLRCIVMTEPWVIEGEA